MWGSGRNGQLGNNAWVGSLTPVRIDSLSAVNVKQATAPQPRAWHPHGAFSPTSLDLEPRVTQ